MRPSPSFLALLLIASFVCLAAASRSLPSPSTDPRQEAGEEHEELEEAMDTLQSGARGLRRALKDAASNESSLETIAGMQAAALVAFGHVPEPETALDADALAGWDAGYKRRLLAVATTLVDMEEQVRKGDNTAAQETWKKLMDLKKAGHEIYYPE